MLVLAASENGVLVLSSGFSSDALSLETISGPMSWRQNRRSDCDSWRGGGQLQQCKYECKDLWAVVY